MQLKLKRQARVGVLGASGRLGTLIVREAASAGLETIPMSSRTDLAQSSALAEIEALIIASPSRNSDVHGLALEAGCHVIDVGIDETAIRSALAFDDKARDERRRIVLMAGLAPGMSGMMALDFVRRFPAAKAITVVLVQSSQGAAGKRGVSDMLDMLTDPLQPKAIDLKGLGDVVSGPNPRGFWLPTPERTFLKGQANGQAVTYLTLFDAEWTNRGVEYLGRLRQSSQPLYRFAREILTSVKSKQPTPSSEDVHLVALATEDNGEIVGREILSFVSDYGATAKTACALTLSALSGEPPFGAGHPSAFTDLSSLSAFATGD